MDKINFKASYIGNSKVLANTKLGPYRNKTVSVVELNPKSKQDLETFKTLLNDWTGKHILIMEIFFDFIDFHKKGNNHFYHAITTQKNNFDTISPEKILGVIEYTHDKTKKYDYIDYIQVNPKYMNEKQNRKIKNIGAALLDVVKQQQNGFKNIYLNTTRSAQPFYEKNGFKVVEADLADPLMKFERFSETV